MQTKNKTTSTESSSQEHLPLKKINYILLSIGFFIIVIGFLFMIGGKSPDPAEFNEAIFNFQRITLAPILVVVGFLFEIFAIMYRGKK